LERSKIMKKMRVLLLTSLLVLVLATTAFSWGGGPGGFGRGPGYGPCAGGDPKAFSGLNLTTEQEEKISALQETQLKETKPLRDKLFAKRGDLRLLWLEKSPDQEKIMAAQKELRSLRDQMEDKMTAHRLAMLKILTPEQQSKVKSLIGKRMGRGHGMGFGPGPGGCPGGGFR
jgi:Spy/CpxP family protein refolding chaperone